jgi:hypothetical protein
LNKKENEIEWLAGGQWFDVNNVLYPTAFQNSSKQGWDNLLRKHSKIAQVGGNFQSRVIIAKEKAY